jgi:predicted Zn finger-like uncharacterized protein
MIIACPNCATSYTVDSSAFGNESRTVRCSACGHAWLQSGKAPETAHERGGVTRAARKAAPRLQRQPAPAPAATPAPSRGAKASRRPAAKPSVTAPIDKPEDRPAPALQPSVAAAKPTPTPTPPAEPKPAAAEPGRVADKTRPAAAMAAAAAEAPSASAPTPVAPSPPEAAEDHGPARGWISSAEAKESAEGDLDFATEGEPPATETPATAADAEPTLSATARADAREQLRAAQKKGVPSQRRPWIVPAAAAAALVIVASGLIGARDGIIRHFPATAGAYNALGMGGQPTLGAGLKFHDVSTSREWSGAEEVLVVQGAVVNDLKAPATLLPVRVALYDSDDREVQAVTVPNDQNRIKPGEMVHFEARIANPSLSAQRVRVTFATPGAEKAS